MWRFQLGLLTESIFCWMSWVLKYIGAIRLIIVFSTTFQSITFALQNHHRWDKQQRFIEHYEILYRDKKQNSFEDLMCVINSKRALSYLKGYHKKEPHVYLMRSHAQKFYTKAHQQVFASTIFCSSADNFFPALGIGTPRSYCSGLFRVFLFCPKGNNSLRNLNMNVG